jgi:hypothetical protein
MGYIAREKGYFFGHFRVSLFASSTTNDTYVLISYLCKFS